MSTSRKSKKPANGPDGSDGGRELSSKSEGAVPLEKTIDPLVEEYGALFTSDEKTTKANQIALAAKFSRDHQVLFDAEASSFLKYNATSGLWEDTKEPAIKVRLARFIKQEAEKNDAADFIPKRTNSFLGAVLQLLKGFTIPDLAARLPALIHVGNGMLDLSVSPAVLRPFSADLHSRRMCSIAYQPGTKCSRFLDDLLGPAISPEDVLLLQRFFGAVLLGTNAAQRFLIVSGEAARGKSTVITLLEWIIGLVNVAHLRTDHLPGRFETHGFLNKTLLTAKDVSGDFLARKGAQMLKALVGDDLIESELKYGGKFRLRGNFNIVVTTNNRLRLAMEEDEPAWRRRLLVINFAGTPPKQRIANFGGSLLREESEGILTWMVEGAVAHLKELERHGDFHLSEAQQGQIDELLQQSQSPAVFIRNAVTKQQGGDITVEELKQGYLDFCHSKKWEPYSARQFENALVDLMQSIHGVLRRNDITRGGKSQRGFKHVTLNATQSPSNRPIYAKCTKRTRGR